MALFYDKKIIALLLGILIIPTLAQADKGDKIFYRISPLGKAWFVDNGQVQFEGKPYLQSVFHARMLGFEDVETIYMDIQDRQPLHVERKLKWWFGRELIIEDYDKDNNTLTVKKYRSNKLVETRVFMETIPSYQAIVFPIHFPKITKIEMGYLLKTAFAQVSTVSLKGLETISVQGGRFKAYHFQAVPYEFDIWISDDENQIPLMVKGRGGYRAYAMKLQKFVQQKNHSL